MTHPPLEAGCFYHVYNRSNGWEQMFPENNDCYHFLWLLRKFIYPVAETYGWVLMPNHFHFLVKIREGIVYKYSKQDFTQNRGDAFQTPTGHSDAVGFEKDVNTDSFDDLKWETVYMDNVSNSLNNTSPSSLLWKQSRSTNNHKPPNPKNHFSHFYNAYAKYINNKYNRHGNLFKRQFSRKPVDNERYLQQLILYIHNNPVHHGFVAHPSEYQWSSYHTCLSSGVTKLERSAVLEWFSGVENFKAAHDNYSEDKVLEIDEWLEIANF